MSLRMPSPRAIRLIPRQLTRQPRLSRTLLPSAYHFSTSTSRLLSSRTEQELKKQYNPLDPIALHRIEAERRAYYARRSYYAAAGFILGMVAIWVTATWVPLPPDQPSKEAQLDSDRAPDDPLVVLGRERKVIVQKLGEEPEEREDVVQTGTSTVPTFPRVLDFVDDERELQRAAQGATKPGESGDVLVEYQLLGLGIRTVSFLGIQVYVVGVYVATEDIAALQQKLVRRITKDGSTLVAGEKEQLKAKLFDPEEGMDIWNEVLKDAGLRTLVRIVPTRNTDFHHLRDAWVRHLTAKTKESKDEFGDEAFGQAVGEFKQLFNRGSVPKGKELLLSRDKKGKLAVWYDDGKAKAQRLGDVKDERISRVVWLNYLAGKTVACEGARKSIIEGVMEFVERPVGTVATQVQLRV